MGGLEPEGLSTAGFAGAALLMVGTSEGVAPAVRRQLFLLAQMGVRHVALAAEGESASVSGMEDLKRIEGELLDWAGQLGIEHLMVVTAPSTSAESVPKDLVAVEPVDKSGQNWSGFLEDIELVKERAGRLPFRLPVESVRQMDGGTAVTGTVVSGWVRQGERIRIQPMGKETVVVGVTTEEGGEQAEAAPGERVELMLAEPMSIAEGSVVSTVESPASVADQFEATVIWLHREPLFPSRRYQARIGAQTADFTVTDIKYELAADTKERLAASQLRMARVGVCNISLNRPVVFDPYRENPATGQVTIIDRKTGEELGLALLHFALRRAENIHIQHVDIDKTARAAQKTQYPCVVWFTGLSGSGKSTIANRVEQQLYRLGHHTYLLDGDNVRHGLNRDLGFTEADRVENIRRVGEVAKLMVDAGLIVLTAFISPFRTERQMARDLLTDGEFLEVFVDVPLEVAEERDPKGLYKKARRGQLKNFTGIDSPYEVPERAELVVDTSAMTAEEAADQVIDALRARGRLPAI
jgi:bifunctional enzyme CysN/CysC